MNYDEDDWSDNFVNVPYDALSERQRDVVFMRWVCGMSFPEIAEEMGCQVGAAKQIHARAMFTLQYYLCGLIEG